MQPPQHDVDAMTFRLLMERADNALQNSGMIVPGRAAMADWKRFSIGLREQFFEAMKAAPVSPPELTDIAVSRRRQVEVGGVEASNREEVLKSIENEPEVKFVRSQLNANVPNQADRALISVTELAESGDTDCG